MHKNLVDINVGAKFSEVTHRKNPTYHHSYENYIRERTKSSFSIVNEPFNSLSSDVTSSSIDSKQNVVYPDPRSERKNFNNVVTNMTLENVKIDLSNEIENIKRTDKICKIVSDKLIEKGLIENSRSVLNNENNKTLLEEKACGENTPTDNQIKSETCDIESKKDTVFSIRIDGIDGPSDLQKNDDSNNVILITILDNLESIKENYKTDLNCPAPKNSLEKENLASDNSMDMTKIDDSLLTKVNCILNDIPNGSCLENKNLEKATDSSTKENNFEKKVSKHHKKDTKHSKRSKDSKSKRRHSPSKKGEKHKTGSNKDSKHKETSNENPVLNTLDSKKVTNDQENSVVKTLACPEISPNTCDKDTILCTKKNDIINDNMTPVRGSLYKKEVTGIDIISPAYKRHTTVSPSIIDNNTIKFIVHRRRNLIVKT